MARRVSCTRALYRDVIIYRLKSFATVRHFRFFEHSVGPDRVRAKPTNPCDSRPNFRGKPEHATTGRFVRFAVILSNGTEIKRSVVYARIRFYVRRRKRVFIIIPSYLRHC